MEPTIIDNLRKPVSGISRATSAALLADPKQRLSRGQREYLLASRGEVCLDSKYRGQTARPGPVKLALYLQKLNMRQLISRVGQFARRSSTAAHLSAKIHDDSPYKQIVQRAGRAHHNALEQAKAEITARTSGESYQDSCDAQNVITDAR